MAAVKSVFSSFSSLLVILILAVVVQSQVGLLAEAQQSCSAAAGNLTLCTPFVVPGSSSANATPSRECCGALQAIAPDCLCNTVRITAHLPTRCNLPPLSCPQN
ncbi:hypothetical protein Leryth_008415 [Lithospermum erythrorhizon]|uniref:Bifunctional inhibitor/plant lipid transfer protein/seed storage helical domain-containing protein n=1 Tax=Lithospermum erythrorhizon TaxID=34254 RepID=A0AAV3RVK5_LITER|nr:hypothetical protein Leryth_008415 [Lithospermum erythrorhizon]